MFILYRKQAHMKGLVIRNTGSWYLVKTADDREIECKIKGNFRLKGIRSTNPIAIGDRVEIEINQEGTAFIFNIEERQNYIIRKSSNLSKESHIIATNLDQAFLIATISHPKTSTTFIDRFLATAEAYRIPARLIINKIDLYTTEEREYADALCRLYRSIGYDCYPISAQTGENIETIRELLSGKITLLSGNSGVGKSTLINALIPGLILKTGAISTSHHKGMHTTTFSEMFPLPQGGYLIDTPGIKGFGTIDFETDEVAHFFPEIFRESQNCKFNNCSHRHEPDCAVLQAIADHRISESRYASYLSIIDDRTENKYRQAY